MAKTKVSEWDSTPGNNTDIDSINIAEGCAPSGINNAIRELMSQVKDFQQGTYSDPFNGPVNGTIGATTPAAGAFTTLTASSTATLNTLASSGATLTGGSINNMAIGGSTAAAGAFTTLAASGAVTLSGGTANGVAYLNGSKVLTTGSALTFNGTNLSVTGSLTSSNAGNENVFLSDGSVVSSLQNGANSLYFNVNTNSATSGNFIWRNTSSYSEQMRLTSTGLGIGTSSPGEKLDVFGGKIRHTLAGGGVQLVLGNSLNAVSLGSVQANGDASLAFYTNTSTERMRLDASGNLGLGVTPSAWNGYKAIQVNEASLAATTGSNTALTSNGFYDGTSWKYIYSNFATRYLMSSGAHQWYTAPSGTAGNAISFTQAMTLDASGNLGIGATSLEDRLTVGTYSGSNAITIGAATTGYGSVYFGDGSGTDRYRGFVQYYHATDALILGTTGAERARIDSSGNFGIGTSSPASYGNLAVFGSGNGIVAVGQSTSYTTLQSNGQDFYLNMKGSGSIVFRNGSGDTERARIDSSGSLLVGTTTSSGGVSGAVNAPIGFAINRNLTDQSGRRNWSIATESSNVGDFCILGSTSNTGAPTTVRLQIRSDGSCFNGSGTWGTLSDVKLKENIVDTAPKLADLLQVRVVNYNRIGEQRKELGVIAQELEQIFPGMIDEQEDLVDGQPTGATTKAVKYSVFVPILIKAIQEQQAIINQLKARLDAANL